MPEKNLQKNQSEVACLLAQIQEEYESATLGLKGLSAGSSQHATITKKMERIADLHTELRGLVGDQAMVLVSNMLAEASASTAPSS